jgi:hypothetical protein
LWLVAGQIEKNYSCCSSKTNTIGCAVSQYHVHDGDDTQLLSGYVKTQPLRKQLNPDESYGIFALDCEMVRILIYHSFLKSFFSSVIQSMVLNLFVLVLLIINYNQYMKP